LLSQAAPNVGANPLEINTVSPSTIFINCANPSTSPQAAFTLGKFEISSILSSGIFLTSKEIGPCPPSPLKPSAKSSCIGCTTKSTPS